MPELPDIILYVNAFDGLIGGRVLESIRVAGPHLLRTVNPPILEAEGRRIESVGRLGKRIVWSLEGDLHLVFHLMIAGRFQLPARPSTRPPKNVQAVFRIDGQVVWLIEGGTRKRASLHFLGSSEALRRHHRPGLNPLTADRAIFAGTIAGLRRTLKRVLTDPRTFDGIGNAYSDEILHAARLSPFRLADSLTPAEVDRLHRATRDVLNLWIHKLADESGAAFPRPSQISAFRPDFAVHGQFGQPCPVCRTRVARIRYRENETNYCPRCQTNGRLLADRSLSRLLKDDWPRSPDEDSGT